MTVLELVTALALVLSGPGDARQSVELAGWERALAVRSQALNRKYGLGGTPTGSPAPPPAPAPSPSPPPAPDPAPVPVPIPIPTPPATNPTPSPASEGYERPDLAAAVAAIGVSAVSSVFCRTDATWPSAIPTATGYWLQGGAQLTMRTWRCDGLAPAQVGTELFARSLFVLAHEATHAQSITDECEADKGGVAKMRSLSAALGFGAAAGIVARDLLLSIYRAAPLPPPYCLGSF